MTSYFRLFCYFLDPKKCRDYVDPGFKEAKTSHNMSRGPKWARFGKEYLPSDWTSDTIFLMTGGAGCDLSVRTGILIIQHLTKL